MSTVRHVLGSALRIDRSQFEGVAALRCTAGVAIPLLAGLLLRQPLVAVFGAVGAVSVGFGSFQGAYRTRASLMVCAAAAMAVSIFVGSLAGHASIAAVAVAVAAAFGAGMLVAVGPAASFVGLQSVVAVLIAGGYPANTRDALLRAATVFAGGLIQTVLVTLVWPLRRFSAERQTIAAAYRSLAAYARELGSGEPVPPEPHTLAATQSPLADPQPFATAGAVLVFQALLDEAERVRASLAGLATQHRRINEQQPACLPRLAELTGRALLEIASALEAAREPREGPPIWDPLEACARQLTGVAAVQGLLGQLRAAWRIAGAMTPDAEHAAVPASRLAPLRRMPPAAEGIATLRANLTLRSSAYRHALRLAVTVGVATIAYRMLGLPRGYWIPMTALLVLRPEFHDTLARGVARIAGTILGAACATVIVDLFSPGPAVLAGLVLVCVWACYALFRMNYALFAIVLTGYVVFLLMMSGIPEMAAATTRIVYTTAGGALALCAYGAWPTWAATGVRPALADMLDAHREYVRLVLGAYADPGSADVRRIGETRAVARLARSNAEALIQRMLEEPEGRAAMPPRVAVSLLAALRRHALAALALDAGVERGVQAPVPGITRLAEQVITSLEILASSVRSGVPPRPLPPLRDTERRIAADAAVSVETDLMVDSINGMADLLRQPSARHSADVT